MNNYKIKLYNSNGDLVYNEIIQHEDENKALIEFIKIRAVVVSGDTIKIENEDGEEE